MHSIEGLWLFLTAAFPNLLLQQATVGSVSCFYLGTQCRDVVDNRAAVGLFLACFG